MDLRDVPTKDLREELDRRRKEELSGLVENLNSLIAEVSGISPIRYADDYTCELGLIELEDDGGLIYHDKEIN